MNSTQITGAPVSAVCPTLDNIVKDLIDEAAPIAVDNHNSIINEIPKGLALKAPRHVISETLNKIVRTVTLHTKHSGILISAKAYGYAILVQVRTHGRISPALDMEMEPAALKAKHSGGVVEFVRFQENQASVAYCFMNVTS